MSAQLLRSATIQRGEHLPETVDILIDDTGRIAEIGSTINLAGGVESVVEADVRHVDMAGRLVLPAAVEPHAHLDKAFLAEVVQNRTGDLIGAIDAMRASRHLLNVEETAARAERAARKMAANGFVAVRTHADVTMEHGLTSIEALVRVRERLADLIDIEIVALCGWPISGPEGADQRALLGAALDTGANIVGGCPHLEAHAGSGSIESATDVLLQVATDRRLPIDLHTDETLDPAANGLELLAARIEEGFDLPATASHCVSLGQRSASEQAAIAERVSAANVHVITLPHTNLFLQGRGTAPMPRSLTAVAALRHAGANVAAGADNLQDPFNPVGRACAFETAGLMIMTSHLLPGEAWETVSANAALALGRDRAGLAVGDVADLVAVPAAGLREAIAEGPRDAWVWRRGIRTDADT